MGEHYIPQFYLKGFTDNKNPSLIWVYEKGSKRVFSTSPSKIAQEKRFYPEKVETYLANEIEAPANSVIKKIRDRKTITHQDKISLSNYIVVLFKRVPKAKERLKTAAPKVSKDLKKMIDTEIEELKKKNPTKIDLLEKRRKEAQDTVERIKGNSLEDVWLDVIPPEMTPKMSGALSKMMWRFFICEEPNPFLTCDNPVFFHKSIFVIRNHRKQNRKT